MKGKRIVIVGGCGHVGLPLGVKIALAGIETVLLDINGDAIRQVMSGKFPFIESGGDEQLQNALESGLLSATDDITASANADVVVFVTGTPVDEHLNPKLRDVLNVFDSHKANFAPGTLVVMRSTLFPGTMEHLYEKIKAENLDIDLAFCPERVAEGRALDEIDSLPQIVSAFEDKSFRRAKELFGTLAPSIIRLTPLEAELSKLMANSWRYLEFAIANQFYMIAESQGVDFYRIYQAIRHDYPRASGYKSPGFAAGPCLFKDTMQLASFFDHQFYLGHSAMLVNEGLAGFVVKQIAQELGGSLRGKCIGILGMAFKANNDDTRESLSFKVKKGLEFAGGTVLCHDPYSAERGCLEDICGKADGLILCTPHNEYKELSVGCPVVDVWGYFSQPALEVYAGARNGDVEKPAEKGKKA